VATVSAVSPHTGALLGEVPAASERDVAAAVERAAAVQRLWAQLRLRDRARYMERAAQAVIDELDDLVELVVAEQGRPRAEVHVMEVLPAVRTLQWLAAEGPGVLRGERIRFSRSQHPVKRGGWSYEPLGVVAVLGAAAEPFASPLGDVAVALLAGNGVVLKPSPHVALCGARIAGVFARAGLPEGLLGVVQGHAATGAALVDAPVAQVRFTGGAEAGRAVGEACARGLKRSVLDLGGKDAMLVLPDASLPRVVRGATWAAFANAGQSGGSVERLLCAAPVYEAVLAGVAAAAEALRAGDPAHPATELGPLVTRERTARVRELVDDAVARGAVRHTDGPAVVLSDVPADARIAREECPGPVLVVERVRDEDEAVLRANAVPFALGASVWTADRRRGARVARELRAGMVWMNDHLVARSAPQVPWGGIGTSGIGRARGAIALRTCAEPKVVTWDPPVSRPAWWFPYDDGLAAAAGAAIRLRSRRDADRRRGLRDAPALLGLTARWARGLRDR
jgi:acyl-CoA reductase-like NAD-dependent aldehyde dehydrogenase